MPISEINQFVSPAAVNSLLDSAPAPLSGWYATPLLPAQAGRLHRAVAHVIQARLRAGESCFQQHLLLICCSGTLSVSQRHYSELQQVAANAHERALLELVYGQWLACRKLLPAMRHLEEGFRLAAPILGNRHAWVGADVPSSAGRLPRTVGTRLRPVLFPGRRAGCTPGRGRLAAGRTERYRAET